MRWTLARALVFAFGSFVTGLGCKHQSPDSTGDVAGMPGGAGGTGAALAMGDAGRGGVDRSWAEWPMPNCPGDITAGAPNPESYTDNGDGTVTDNVTGLMWQQTVSTTTYSWADALAFCPSLSLAGYDDWRLPTRIELVSIVDDSLTDATMDSANFPGTPAGYFWTSSRLAGSLTDAWVVVFNGGTYTVLTSDSSYVRCVR